MLKHHVDFSESGFVCMEVSRKSDSIMSVRLGRLSRNPEEACNQHLFFDKSIQPIIIVSAKHGHRQRCPLVGKYSISRQYSSQACVPGSHKSDHLMFGCTGEATEFSLVAHNQCKNTTTTTGSDKPGSLSKCF